MQRSKEILNELEQLSMVVAGISRQMPYEAPEGYFSDFPGKLQTQLRSIAKQFFEQGEIMRSGNDQYFIDPCQHEGGQGIIDHGFIINGHDLFADSIGYWM